MRRGLPSFNERDATGRDGGEDGFEGSHKFVVVGELFALQSIAPLGIKKIAKDCSLGKV